MERPATVKQEGIGIIKQLALNLQMPSLFEGVEKPVLSSSEAVKEAEKVVKFENFEHRPTLSRFIKKTSNNELF